MRSPSLEWLHAKIEKSIKLAPAYTGIDELEFIIKSCRLKPYDYVFKERKNQTILYDWWFDEFGNSLFLNGKKPSLTYNDLKLDRKKIVSTDLYFGLSLKKIAKMSKLVHIIAGKDDDEYQDFYLITFFGIDDHLRSYLYMYNEWQQVSPMLMGLKNLKFLAKYSDIKYFFETTNKENSRLPCVSEWGWISCLPASPVFVTALHKQSETLSDILK